MNEEKYHALLKHENIVQYFFSWEETQTYIDQERINNWIEYKTGCSASDPDSELSSSQESTTMRGPQHPQLQDVFCYKEIDYLYIVI